MGHNQYKKFGKFKRIDVNKNNIYILGCDLAGQRTLRLSSNLPQSNDVGELLSH